MAAAASRARTALSGIVSGQLITSAEEGRVVAMVRGHDDVDVLVGVGADHTDALNDAADRAPALARALAR